MEDDQDQINRPPKLISGLGNELTGVECRILRASLGLERRHVARFAEAMGYGRVEPTVERVTAWEKSKGRGYPPDLVDGLDRLDAAVDAWASEGAAESVGEWFAEMLRPLGHRHALRMLAPDRYGLRFTPDQLEAIDQPNGEFWLALADTAIARAALYLRDRGPVRPMLGRHVSVRVVLDREPDGASTPAAPAEDIAPTLAAEWLPRIRAAMCAIGIDDQRSQQVTRRVHQVVAGLSDETQAWVLEEICLAICKGTMSRRVVERIAQAGAPMAERLAAHRGGTVKELLADVRTVSAMDVIRAIQVAPRKTYQDPEA